MAVSTPAAANREAAQINRDQAIANFFHKLTELVEVGRDFLQKTAEAELNEREQIRQRRAERMARAGR